MSPSMIYIEDVDQVFKSQKNKWIEYKPWYKINTFQ